MREAGLLLALPVGWLGQQLLRVTCLVSIATSPGALSQPGSCGLPEPLHGS